MACGTLPVSRPRTGDFPNGDTMKFSPRILSCDWGTSRFRLRLVDRPSGRILAEHTTDEGAQTIAAKHRSPSRRRAAFAAALQRALETLDVARDSGVPLVISGMACSTIGWIPQPYAPLPVGLDGAGYRICDLRIKGRKVRFVSGLSAECDVIRGEECELTGLFGRPARRALAEDCVVVLPGTHSKHVRLLGGRITDFSTRPTGELFALLSRHSTLVGGAAPAGFSSAAFLAGVRTARQMDLGAALFKVRARSVLGHMRPEQGADFLSGVLIGAELICLPPAGRIVISAGSDLAHRYALAARTLIARSRVTLIPRAEAAGAVVRGHLQLASDL